LPVSVGREIENELWRAAELQGELDEARAEIDEARAEIERLRQRVIDALRRIAWMTLDLGEGVKVAARLRVENEALRGEVRAQKGHIELLEDER
jgi:cob(I)alamin adenosyltransferase